MTEQRDFWNKLEIISKASSALIAGIFVTIITLIGRGYFEERAQNAETANLEREQRDANARLLAQLISKREESESALRKDMFGHIIKQFLGGDDDGDDWSEMGRQVLNLEILTYNFHNALDLGPLFQDLNLRIRDLQKMLHANPSNYVDGDPAEAGKRLDGWADRLERAARDVNSKQVSSLDTGDNKKGFEVYFDEVLEAEGVLNAFERDKILDYHVEAEILDVNKQNKQVRIKLLIWYPEQVPVEPAEDQAPESVAGKTETVQKLVDPVFWVGFFDFPMIDNTRLPDGRRMAVVLEKFTEQDARLNLIFFDGARASLKDRPYYEDVFKDLRNINELTQAGQSQ